MNDPHDLNIKSTVTLIVHKKKIITNISNVDQQEISIDHNNPIDLQGCVDCQPTIILMLIDKIVLWF